VPRSLPPLTALRAFEAAARLLSFTKAARELHVTPAAVSHQIRGLEEYLGVTLFRRTTRRLVLTEQGALAAEHVSEGFGRIARGVDLLRASGDGGLLTVGTTPSFATRWLLPRLGRFTRRYPDIQLRLRANTGPVDFDSDEVDVAIRFGGGGTEGLRAVALFGECIAPLASPSLARQRPLRRPSDLARVPLLHDASMRRAGRRTGWSEWFRAAEVANVDSGTGLHFDDGHLVLQAAALGRGVALGRLAYAVEDLAAHRLRVPFGPVLRMDLRYHLLVPEGRATEPAITAFCSWLAGEAEGFRRVLEKQVTDLERRSRPLHAGVAAKGKKR
jgi:LysR family glycine cleavage system transcriptional activator